MPSSELYAALKKLAADPRMMDMNAGGPLPKTQAPRTMDNFYDDFNRSSAAKYNGNVYGSNARWNSPVAQAQRKLTNAQRWYHEDRDDVADKNRVMRNISLSTSAANTVAPMVGVNSPAMNFGSRLAVNGLQGLTAAGNAADLRNSANDVANAKANLQQAKNPWEAQQPMTPNRLSKPAAPPKLQPRRPF